MKTRQYLSQAFTVIEIMVVLSVIAIVGAIAYVGYGDYQTKVATADTQNALKAVHAAMESEKNFSSGYPVGAPNGSIPTSNFSQSSANSSKVTVVYITGSATTYCARAASVVRPTIVYYIKPPTIVDPTTTQPASCP